MNHIKLILVFTCFILGACKQISSPKKAIEPIVYELAVYGHRFRDEKDYRTIYTEYIQQFNKYIEESGEGFELYLAGEFQEDGTFKEISYGSHLIVCSLSQEELRELSHSKYFYSDRMTGITYAPLSVGSYKAYTFNETPFRFSVDEEEFGIVFLDYLESKDSEKRSLRILLNSPAIWEKLVRSITKYKKKPYPL